MLKIIAIITMFSICTYLGYYYGEIYKDRCSQLKELEKSLILMNSEILYTNSQLSSVFITVSTKIKGPIHKIFMEIAEMLEGGESASVYDIFINSYENNKQNLSLNKEDYNIVSDFFNSLGTSSLYGQEKIFNLTLERLKRNYEESVNEAKVYSKMYRTLGLSIGAILTIFFI